MTREQENRLKELEQAVHNARVRRDTAGTNSAIDALNAYKREIAESGGTLPETSGTALRNAVEGTVSNTFDLRGDGTRTLSELSGVDAATTERNVAAARESAARNREAVREFDRVTNTLESDGEVHSREDIATQIENAKRVAGTSVPHPENAPTGKEAKRDITADDEGSGIDFDTTAEGKSSEKTEEKNEEAGKDSLSGNGKVQANAFLQEWADTHPSLFHAIFGKSVEKGGDNPLTFAQRAGLLGSALAHIGSGIFGGAQAGFNRQQYHADNTEWQEATKKYMEQGIQNHLGTFQDPERLKQLTNGYLEQAKMYTEKALELREKANELRMNNYAGIMGAVSLKVGLAKGLQSSSSSSSEASGSSHTGSVNGNGELGVNVGVLNLGGGVTGNSSDSTNASYTSSDGKSVDLLGISALGQALKDAQNMSSVTADDVKALKAKFNKAADDYDRLAAELRKKAADYAKHEIGSSKKEPEAKAENATSSETGAEGGGNKLDSDERMKDFKRIAGNGFLKNRRRSPFTVKGGADKAETAEDSRKDARNRASMQSQVNQLISQSMATNPAAQPMTQIPAKS